MAPRTYTLKRRAEAATATRRRIVDATRELYRENGISGTTLTAVADRADVARGTILNHFGTSDGLLEAVMDVIVTELEYPDERVQDGAGSRSERIRRYVDAMFRFFVRSEADWPAFSRDMDLPILKRREAEYYAVAARLFAATFGDLANDRYVAAAARAYVNYAPLDDLRAAGLSLDEAITLVGDTLVHLADTAARRAKQAGERSRG
jgi:AcrR family transcriptional regulator